MSECDKASHHQPRSERKNNRHCDLRNYKKALQLPSPQTATDCLRTGPERFIQIGLGSVQCGKEAKEN